MPLTNIYALCEPGSQTPRYIGQTTFPLGHRLSNHIASAKRGKSSNGLSTWVNGLVYNGQRPVIVLLEECAPDEADNTETAWIALCQQQGCDLLNLAQLPTPPKQPKPPKKERVQVLTRDTVKMLAVQVSTHGKARELAAALGVPLYLAVDMAIDTALGANKAMRPPSKGDGDA